MFGQLPTATAARTISVKYTVPTYIPPKTSQFLREKISPLEPKPEEKPKVIVLKEPFLNPPTTVAIMIGLLLFMLYLQRY